MEHLARVVDSVSEPLKVRPRLALNTAVSLVLGLMVGIFAALVRNWWAYSRQVTNAQPQE